MKVLALLLFASVVSARPEAGSHRSRRDVKEGKSLEAAASLPSAGLQPMLVYMPDYSLQAPLELPRRRFVNRARPSADRFYAQRPLRPRPQYLANEGLPHTLHPMPFLLTLPIPTIPSQRTYEMDISEWIAGIEESIKAEEDSVLLAASDNKKTSLILKPVAKAVAGPKGVAVASPVAKAILRKGQIVSIDFDPEAVAIAGPGGSADAQPKLIISYASEPQSLESLSSTPSDDLPSSTETATSQTTQHKDTRYK